VAQVPNRQSVTSLDLSPEQEQKQRIVRYAIAMIIRTCCLILGVISSGVLMWVFFTLAIFLPYFAVVLANAQGGIRRSKSERKMPRFSIRPPGSKKNEV
jgi:predicted tellurium resistance membrane protein TerC